MIRKKKLYNRPKKLYEKKRIAEENALAEKYGLKNKREIWKAKAKVDYFRSRAMALAHVSSEEQEVLFHKLNYFGFGVKSTADVLALKVEDILERRLPTIVFKKKLSKTQKEARQMVTHRRIHIHGKVVDVPSYLVPVSEEHQISLKPGKQHGTKNPEGGSA